MAMTSHFYDGPLTETSWAEYRMGSPRYGVEGPGDWLVTAVAGADRTISIAPGRGFGCGVADESDTNVTIQLDPITSGSRWDLIVARRDWAPDAGGPTYFTRVNGTSETALPGGRKVGAGVLDDQPIAFVQVTAGKTEPTAILDLRCWAAGAGAYYIVEGVALQYLEYPGAEVYLDGHLWRYQRTTNGVWGFKSTRQETTNWRDPEVFGNSFRPYVASGWNSVKYRLANGVVHLSGAVQKDLADKNPNNAPAGTPMLRLPQSVAPSRRTPGIGCVVETNGDVTSTVVVGPGGAVSMSATWTAEVDEV